MLTIKGTNNSDGSFNWRDALLDAGILAGLTFFSSIGGMSIIDVNTSKMLIAGAIAAGAQFFLTLAIKRGLREKE